MSQKSKVIEHLQKYGSITGKEAHAMGVTRLREIIHELRKSGVNLMIKKNYVRLKRGGFYYNRYYLLGGSGIIKLTRWERIKKYIKNLIRH